MSEVIQVNAGDFIFKEGDTADMMYVILSGQIELLENRGGTDVQLSVLGEQKIFGELIAYDAMALRPHSARAIEPSRLKQLGRNEFETLLAQCPEDIMPFIKNALNNMRSTKSSIKKHVEAVDEKDVANIIIAPDSDLIKAQMDKPMSVSSGRLPFRIGGYPEDGQQFRRDILSLALKSKGNPLLISRQHCEIVLEDGKLKIVDLGSRFCTTVNGVLIGRGCGYYSALLQKGVNKINLGNKNSQYRLTVTCE